MSPDVTLAGNLSDIRLPTLLMSLHRERETGILTLSDGAVNRALYVSEGTVVYASSSDPDDGLLEGLFRRGLLSLNHYLEAQEAAHGGRSVHQVLVDLGALSPEEVVEGVTQNLYDIAFSLFSIRHGSYRLHLAPFSTLEMVTLSLDIPVLLFRGLERVETWSQIYADVGPPSTRLRRLRDLPSFVAELDLGSDAEHVLSLTRNGMSVASIVEASYLTAFQTYRLLWIFKILGLVEREEGAREPSAASPEEMEALLDRYNDLYAYVHRHLEGHPEAEEIFGALLRDLQASHPELAEGQTDLGRFGKLDVDLVLWNLRRFPEGERERRLLAFLEETLYALVLASQQRLSAEDHGRILAYVRHHAAAGGER
jgi:hypothetical protein